jgi:hypothetical protein
MTQTETQPVLVYHYTHRQALKEILRSGVLRVTERNHEPRIVWCSIRDDWEPSAARAELLPGREASAVTAKFDEFVEILGRDPEAAARWFYDYFSANLRYLGPKEIHERGGGLARIGVAPETAPYTWPEIVERSGIPEDNAWLIEVLDLLVWGGNPADWRGSFEPIPRDRWVTVEVLGDDGWQPYTTETRRP